MLCEAFSTSRNNRCSFKAVDERATEDGTVLHVCSRHLMLPKLKSYLDRVPKRQLHLQVSEVQKWLAEGTLKQEIQQRIK